MSSEKISDERIAELAAQNPERTYKIMALEIQSSRRKLKIADAALDELAASYSNSVLDIYTSRKVDEITTGIAREALAALRERDK